MRAACCKAEVLGQEAVAADIRRLRVRWPDPGHAPHAGQFFTLRSWGAGEAPFLSRPISVHKWEPETLTVTFLYQVIGEGTAKLAALAAGDLLQLTGPMGNGFDVGKCGQRTLVIVNYFGIICPAGRYNRPDDGSFSYVSEQ